ncbi:MAG: DUF4411 family protein [Deltaproteobacteria bacterium]|nr:DUF4411 family protein [Deltaproteobacteria bacterium]
MAEDNINGNIYFIDTSSLVEIFRDPQSHLIDQIWEKVEELFSKGRMFSHRFVYDEITTDSKRPDILSKKITPLQAYFLPVSSEQAQLVSDIIRKFPALIDPENEKEQSAPWLIAEAILEQRQYSLFNPDKMVYIVSELNGSDLEGIFSISKSLGLGHLDLSGFYRLYNR